MELGSIEHEVFVDAAPEIVYEVVSSPDHVRQWWADDARYEPEPGGEGHLVFGNPGSGRVELLVVEAEPPRTFSFRWTHRAGERAVAGNSLLVTFELTPSGAGTRLRMTETGFREMGWEAAHLEQQHVEHVTGWGHFVPRLVAHAERVATSVGR